MRWLEQRFLATGTKVTIPAFFGFTRWVTTPLRLDGLVRIESVEPLIRTLMPAFACLCWETCRVRSVEWPTRIDFGETASAVQYCTGGVNGPFTTTDADAVLLAVLDSASAPTTVVVLVSVPVWSEVVTSVIVTVAPLAMLPSWQLMIVPPVQVPCVVLTEPKDVPAGSGWATFTAVAPVDPVFGAVIVQVIWLPSVEELGAPDFAIARSITGGGGGVTGGGGGGFCTTSCSLVHGLEI